MIAVCVFNFGTIRPHCRLLMGCTSFDQARNGAASSVAAISCAVPALLHRCTCDNHARCSRALLESTPKYSQISRTICLISSGAYIKSRVLANCGVSFASSNSSTPSGMENVQYRVQCRLRPGPVPHFPTTCRFRCGGCKNGAVRTSGIFFATHPFNDFRSLINSNHPTC
jgi:hypothetical protein